MTTTDRIEKEMVLRAPRARVWRALTTAREFGAWFGIELENEFAPGEVARGRIPHPEFGDLTLELTVERMEPEHLFSYRWHPAAIDPSVDYSAEPTTLVEFRLEEVDGGTRLALVESGFDRIPEARRAKAFRMNSGGWDYQMENIRKHVEG